MNFYLKENCVFVGTAGKMDHKGVHRIRFNPSEVSVVKDYFVSKDLLGVKNLNFSRFFFLNFNA